MILELNTNNEICSAGGIDNDTGIKSSEAFIRSSAYSHRFIKIRFKTAFEIPCGTSHAISIFFEAKLAFDGSKKIGRSKNAFIKM